MVSSWWFRMVSTHLKNMLVTLDHFPRGENKTLFETTIQVWDRNNSTNCYLWAMAFQNLRPHIPRPHLWRIFSRKIAPKKSERFFQRATNGGPTWLPPVTHMTDVFCPISGMFHKMFYRIHREASFLFFKLPVWEKNSCKKAWRVDEWLSG